MCWGWNSMGQTDLPTDSQYAYVSAGYGQSCTISRVDRGIRCYGDRFYFNQEDIKGKVSKRKEKLGNNDKRVQKEKYIDRIQESKKLQKEIKHKVVNKMTITDEL